MANPKETYGYVTSIQEAMTHLSPNLIAPCGMNCGLCIGYLREKNQCPGCRSEDTARLRRSCARCSIRLCEERTGEYCYECSVYPCKRLKNLDKRYIKYRMSMLENLHEIQERGVEDFVEKEKVRWTCPQCGSILSVHRDRCLHCGRLW